MSSFLTRTVSGIIMVLIAIFVLVQGGLWLLLVSAAVSLVGTYELLRAIKLKYEPIGIIAYLSVIVYNALLSCPSCIYTDRLFLHRESRMHR